MLAYNAVDEFWSRLTNTLDSVVNVDLFVGDQLIHHVHHGAEQASAFCSVTSNTHNSTHCSLYTRASADTVYYKTRSHSRLC